MTQLQRLKKLNEYLLCEQPRFRAAAAHFGEDEQAQFTLFRSLVNVRPPREASAAFLGLQDEFLHLEAECRGITDIDDLRCVRDDLYLWRGDITTLRCDAIVNAANSALLGCFCPCHGCIDNAIHTYAGVQLRLACSELMRGGKEPVGQAKMTPAFCLPCRSVLHTVGPAVTGAPTEADHALLASCYRSCLTLAAKTGAESIAFCCISTGEFAFPNDAAAKTAIQTVTDWKSDTGSKIKVIFNVYKEADERLYLGLLGADCKTQK